MNNQKQILDVCCGGKMFYLDKHDKHTLFCDTRRFSVILPNGENFKVEPDMQIDYKNLPFSNESFALVILDPPHIIHGSDKGILCKKYGKLDKSWRSDLSEAFSECWRVLKYDGTLIFKWSEAQIKLSEILQCFTHKPLIVQKSSRTSHFCVFFKGKE